MKTITWGMCRKGKIYSYGSGDSDDDFHARKGRKIPKIQKRRESVDEDED